MSFAMQLKLKYQSNFHIVRYVSPITISFQQSRFARINNLKFVFLQISSERGNLQFSNDSIENDVSDVRRTEIRISPRKCTASHGDNFPRADSERVEIRVHCFAKLRAGVAAKLRGAGKKRRLKRGRATVCLRIK